VRRLIALGAVALVVGGTAWAHASTSRPNTLPCYGNIPIVNASRVTGFDQSCLGASSIVATYHGEGVAHIPDWITQAALSPSGHIAIHLRRRTDVGVVSYIGF
jgi:hypothetical protein